MTVHQMNHLKTPEPFTTHVNLYSLSYLIDVRGDLISIFVFLCYFRLLKMLQIPPWIGPIVKSVIDTLINKTLFVFTFIFVAVIFMFSLSYNLSFGTDVPAFKSLGDSL